MVGGPVLFSAIFVSCSPKYPDLRPSAIRHAIAEPRGRSMSRLQVVVRLAHFRAHRRRVGTILAVVYPSRRMSASDWRGSITGARVWPASLRPQARLRASRRPWSAPVLIRRADLRESAQLRSNLGLKGPPKRHAWAPRSVQSFAVGAASDMSSACCRSA